MLCQALRVFAPLHQGWQLFEAKCENRVLKNQ